MDGTTAVSLFDNRSSSLSNTSLRRFRKRWQACYPARTGGERSRAQTGETGHRARRTRACGGHSLRVGAVRAKVRVRRVLRRGAGNSPVGCRAGSLGRVRRIHSASTIAAASSTAGQTGSTTLVTPINTTSTSRLQRDDLYLSI